MTGSSTPEPVFSLVHFDCGGVRLAAKRWGRVGGMPVLALHGWLDNAASFDVVAPNLSEFDLVCLDAAGQGRSDARAHFGTYNIWQDVNDVFCVAEQLGWEHFALLGHSRGAMTALLAAGTFPERVPHLVLIEGLLPRLAEPEQAPALLRQAIESLRVTSRRSRYHYTTFEDAVQARSKGFVPLCEDDARILAHHGVKQDERGFYWRYDAKHMSASEVRFSLKQFDAFVERIQAASCLILAHQGLLVSDPAVTTWLKQQRFLDVLTLPGGHHLHMNEQGERVAEIIQDRLLKRCVWSSF